MKINERPSDNLRISLAAVTGVTDLVDAGSVDVADDVTMGAVRALERSLAAELTRRQHHPLGAPLVPHRNPSPHDVDLAARLIRTTPIDGVPDDDRERAADTLHVVWRKMRGKQ